MIPKEIVEAAVALRRDLHAHPEPSGAEHRTAERVEAFLREAGLAPRRLAGTGVVADLPEGEASERLLFRADLDALEIEEKTGLPFASKTPGLMHACGHDCHAAILAGLARALAAAPPQGGALPPQGGALPPQGGAFRFCFQPSEETFPGGAAPMIAEGVLDGVAAAVGLHVYPDVPLGKIAVKEGVLMANSDDFDFLVRGRAAHAATPQKGADALLAAADLALALQHFVARGRDPFDACVITVGRMEAGRRRNVVAEEARLEATVRTVSPAVRAAARQAVRRIAEATAVRHGVEVEVRESGGYPAVVNHPAMTDFVRAASRAVLGDDAVVELAFPTLGGEDFAYFAEKVPAVFFRLGCSEDPARAAMHHTPDFSPDERAIGHGISVLAEMARRWGAGWRPGGEAGRP